MAALRVVLPWSMWPMVPTLTCGLVRTNTSLAIRKLLGPVLRPSGGPAGHAPARAPAMSADRTMEAGSEFRGTRPIFREAEDRVGGCHAFAAFPDRPFPPGMVGRESMRPGGGMLSRPRQPGKQALSSRAAKAWHP